MSIGSIGSITTWEEGSDGFCDVAVELGSGTVEWGFDGICLLATRRIRVSRVV